MYYFDYFDETINFNGQNTLIVKSILEQIPKTEGSSFRLLIDPKLHDFYYWHFHPELELVYIEGVDGNRHIGNHKSKFTDGDLAFIGSYIPHLNFDYGIKEKYYKVVLQIDEDFLASYDKNTPELKSILDLIKDARHGIVFEKELKNSVGPMMKKLEGLKGFALFQSVLQILFQLSDTRKYRLVHEDPYQNKFYEKQQEKIKNVISYIEEHYQEKIMISELASLTNYSEAAFCRYFKKMTKLSFTSFLNNYRIDIAKRLLKEGKNVSQTAFSTGFESISYFNRVFRKVVEKSPKQWSNQQS